MQASDIKQSFNMINDKYRNQFYFNALQNVKDKVVLDVGSGLGVLSSYALHHGAKFVYAVERGRKESIISNKILTQNFSKKNFKVINADFWSKNIFENFDHDIDVMVSETINYDILGEGILKTWRQIKNIAHQNFTAIPNQFKFNLLIFENPLDKFVWFRKRFELIHENLLHEGFANSLADVYEKSKSSQLLYEFPVSQCHHADKILHNVINLTFKSYNDDGIKFQCDVDKPSLIMLDGTLIAEDNQLHIHNQKNPTHWSNGLSMYLPEKGTYEISFEENATSNLVKWTNVSTASNMWPYNCTWTYKKIDGEYNR